MLTIVTKLLNKTVITDHLTTFNFYDGNLKQYLDVVQNKTHKIII